MWARLALWAATVLVVAGQTSNVTQCIPTYNWSFNSKGQSPCLVAAYLESACGTPTDVNSIPNGTHYTGPSFALTNDCLCSSVTYSMVSACGGCQGRTYSNWTTWTINCRETHLTTFPRAIPSGTDVPSWAFFNISQSGNNFDPTIAAHLAGIDIPSSSFTTELPAATIPSAPPTSAGVSSTQTVASTTNPASANRVSGSSSHSGAIAGGVVGGLVFVALVLLILLRWYMKRQRNAIQKDLVFDQGALFSGSSSNHVYAQSPEPPYPNNTRSPAPFSSNYDSSELNAYPASPMTSAVHTHLPGSTVYEGRRSVDSLTPSMAQFGASGVSNTTVLQPNRGFRGAAEVA